jgi:hypothetical protein
LWGTCGHRDCILQPAAPVPAAAQAAPHSLPAPCGQSKVVAADEATVVETSAGMVRGFKRNGVYIFKGVPYGASSSGANRFIPPMKPEPWSGIRNALQYMVESAPARTPLTSTPIGRISRIRTKMHSYSIVLQLPRYPVRIAYASTCGPLRSTAPTSVQSWFTCTGAGFPVAVGTIFFPAMAKTSREITTPLS